MGSDVLVGLGGFGRRQREALQARYATNQARVRWPSLDDVLPRPGKPVQLLGCTQQLAEASDRGSRGRT